MNRRPYIDFYRKHAISPVAREINWDIHFIQRKALYNRLGILPCNVRGRKVLEFGPGNSVNSLYTISMEPDHYVLVDGNPTGIENSRENLTRFHPEKNWEIVDSLIEEYDTDEKFDLVICEGLIPNQVNPTQMARHCASFVGEGGIFVVTSHDMISTVSETLRCLSGWLLTRNIYDFDEQVRVLAKLFENHLEHLKGMNRTKEEWVTDNILHTEFWQDAPLFSIEEAISALDQDFIVHATSPWFLQDWRWYKSVENVKTHFNDVMKESYWQNTHNFIDWRIISLPREKSDNLTLYETCKAIRDKVREAANADESIVKVIDKCRKLATLLPEEYTDTKVAIDSYVRGMTSYIKTGEIHPDMFRDFGAWWGRGMQYVSFVRK